MDPLNLLFGLIAVVCVILLFSKTLRADTQLSLQRALVEQDRRALERETESTRKEAVLAAREEAHQIRAAAEQEQREQRAELQRTAARLAQREEALDTRQAGLDGRAAELAAMDQELRTAQAAAVSAAARCRVELERISELTGEQGKVLLLQQLETEIRGDAARLIAQVDADAREQCSRRARQVVIEAIQRCAVDHVSETTVSVVPLPSDEMKGRIIGREGRNIRAFETLTGVDVIIDDTPEAVVLSAFDPVRREIARVTLTTLIADGRIHPGRIEEALARAEEDVERRICEAGEGAVLRSGVGAVHPELARRLGRLQFRTSYGQNVLDHSVQVAHLAATLAAELGVDAAVARRAALLHDVGKAADSTADGSHLEHSVELARKYGESEAVLHAIEAHHGDVEFASVEAVLVQVADAISAARPGARREMLESYVRRMQRLESLVNGLPGVEKSYAVQAGRELRIIVSPAVISEDAAVHLARDTARRIEREVEYPGQIKVIVVRESRAVETAH